MKKVVIIGCPGAGKSEFARRLRDVTQLPLYYLDLLWHKTDKTNFTRDEFDMKINDILKQDKWILDGNYLRTMEIRIKECDAVFFLDYPLDVCLSGIECRIGKKREDMPWIETEFDKEFKQWISDFPTEQLPQIYDLLEKYKQKNIIVFQSREEADSYLQSIKRKFDTL